MWNIFGRSGKEADKARFLKEAKQLLGSRRHRDLMLLCDRFLKQDDTIAEAYGFRGFARQELGDLVGAFHDYSTAIYHDPSYLTCHRERGLVLLRMQAAGVRPADLNCPCETQAQKDFKRYLDYFPEKADELQSLIEQAKHAEPGAAPDRRGM